MDFASPLLQKDIQGSTAEDMGVPDPRPGNQLWSFPFSVVRQGSTIQSIPVVSYVDLETTQFSRIDACTLPATLPQQTTGFQHREIFSTRSSMPSDPPSLKTSPQHYLLISVN